MSMIARSEEHISTIEDDNYLNECLDAVASLVFPHLGFRGWKEHYSVNSPVWKLSYFLPLYAKALEDETGWGLQALLRTPKNSFIPYFDADYINEVMDRVVKRVITEQNWQPMLDIVKAMPCEEDFENWDTFVRRDFLRKWNHSRSKNVQTVSLEACLEDGDHAIYEVKDESADFEDDIASEDYYARFKSQLSPKDRQILQMRLDGYTYAEIADELGYKNHSGVIKRISAITKEFTQYQNKEVIMT